MCDKCFPAPQAKQIDKMPGYKLEQAEKPSLELPPSYYQEQFVGQGTEMQRSNLVRSREFCGKDQIWKHRRTFCSLGENAESRWKIFGTSSKKIGTTEYSLNVP